MYYSVYKTTNMINGKIYIGCHKTENLDDGYIGSGKYLQYAIKKYGRENFKKEILAVFDNKEDMFEMEAVEVNDNFVKNKSTYNLKKGGDGGFDYLNGTDYDNPTHTFEHMQMMSIKGEKRRKDKLLELRNDKDWLENYRKIISEGIQLYYLNGGTGAFKNKSHSVETKKKMSMAKKGKSTGSENSQYGTMWIYSDNEQKSIKIKHDDFELYEKKGWIKGRKIKF